MCLRLLQLFFPTFRVCAPGYCYCLAVILLLLFPLSLAAENRITVAIPQVDPWARYNAQNEPEGMLVELVRALDQRTDRDIHFYLRPLARVIRELERGEVGYSMLFESEQVNVAAESVSHLFTLRILTVASQGAYGQDRPSSLDELTGQRVGYIRGTIYGPEFHQHEGIVRVPVHDIKQGLELLHKRRLHALIGSDVILDTAYNEAPQERQLKLDTLFEMAPIRALFYRSHRVPAGESDRQLQRAIDQLQESGEMEAIIGAKMLPGSSGSALLSEAKR
ncbi:MAG: hypothetical protein EA349_07775 [Halomonadaceae bacterium]|nr:MAG: hypothetical protein EA349_07775 [Halomonadaceae bacterium]